MRLLVGVELCGVCGVLRGMQVVAVRDMRMVSRFLLVLLLMMLCGAVMMLCRLFMVLRRFFVMLGRLGGVHYNISRLADPAPAAGIDTGTMTL